MNDRYLCRAKRMDNGEWVEGNLIHAKKDCYICENPYECMNEYSSLNGQSYGFGGFKLVDSSTICQCTGLKKFDEKDIVIRIDIHKVGDPSIGIIEYDVENTAFVIHWIDKQKYSPMYPWKDKIEVIGNIFDNPELLEVGK